MEKKAKPKYVIDFNKSKCHIPDYYCKIINFNINFQS